MATQWKVEGCADPFCAANFAGLCELAERVLGAGYFVCTATNGFARILGASAEGVTPQDGRFTWHRSAGTVAVGTGAGADPLQPSFGSGTEGIKGQTLRVDRSDLCRSISEALQSGLIWIKAPPQSGKTSLLQLLELYYKQKYPTVTFHYVNCSLWKTNFDGGHPQQLQGRTLVDFMMDDTYHVVAFDEVQSIYDEHKSSSSAFWASIKDLLQGGKKVFVVLAAAYGTTSRAIGTGGGSPMVSEGGSSEGGGSASSDVHTATPGPTPLVLAEVPCQQLVTVQLPGPGLVGHTLALTTDDWADMQGAFKRVTQLDLDPALLAHIYHLCGGQVGLLIVCLQHIDDHTKNVPREKTSKRALWALTSKPFLDRLSSVRSLVRYGQAARTAGSQELLSQLMWRRQVVLEGGSDLMPAARALQWCGIVVISHDNCVTFTSPLHCLWYTHQHYTHRAEPSNNTESKAKQLLLRQLALVSSMLLQYTATRSKAGGPPLEAFWEAELYRVGVLSTVPGTVVSVQAGKADGARGLLDVVYGEPYKVALELLVNGQGISEHLRRFEPDQRYHPLVKSGIVEDWLVVDFRLEPDARQPRLEDERLYTVMVSEDYQTLTVMHEGKQCGEVIKLSSDRTEDALAALKLA